MSLKAVVRWLFQRVFTIIFVFLGSASAVAQPSGITLDAQLPAQLEGCLSAEPLSMSYQHAFAANGGTGAPPLRVQVRSRPGAESDATVLQIVAAAPGRALGARELPVRTSDCAALPEALGLVLALLAKDATPVLAQTPPSAASPAAPSERSASIALGAGAGTFIGVLPSAALALQLQAASPGERLSFRLKAGMLWPQEHALAEGTIQVHSVELDLEACAGWRLPSFSRLALRLCVGPRLGLMYARGRRFGVQNQSARKFLIYLGLMPEVALRLAGATWLQLGAGVALALVRPRFLVGLDLGRQIVELSDPAVLRSEFALSLVQVF